MIDSGVVLRATWVETAAATAKSLLEVAAAMVRFNPQGHSQPDRLKTIQTRNLIRMLEPSREYLETRGLSLPREDELEIDYMKLASILAVPDEWMDARVIEGLHLVGNLGTDENFDQLLDVARR